MDYVSLDYLSKVLYTFSNLAQRVLKEG